MVSALESLATLIVVLVSLLLKAAFRVLVVLLILWMIGALYPVVAHSLGLPFPTLYDLINRTISNVRYGY